MDLTAQNIVSAATKSKKDAETEIKKVLASSGSKYAVCPLTIKLQFIVILNDCIYPFQLITSLQLVGVCLFVFVNEEHLGACTDVAVDVCKTGAKGKAGNKGGAAVRFRLYDSSICFVCAHLAAGQSHIAERNQGDSFHVNCMY